MSAFAYYIAFLCQFGDDPYAVQRVRNNAFERLAFAARYGHVPPSEAGQWDSEDLTAFCAAVARMIEQENKPRD